MRNEDCGQQRITEEQENTYNFAHVQESVAETELVPSLVCLVTVPNSSELVRSISQVQTARGSLKPQEQNRLTCRNKEECPCHNVTGIGVTAVMVG